MAQTVAAMVEGGKASAGPPLGPQLGPLGVKIPDVIAMINEKTQALKGMQVPVKVIVQDDKSFAVEVGTPPVSALIKKELGLDKASKEPGKLRAGDLTHEQVKKVAEMKFGDSSQGLLRQVEGTARSMGITVGQGEVTEEEIQAYEKEKQAEEAAAAEKTAAAERAAAATPTKKEGEAKPAEEEAKKPAAEEDKKTEKKGA